ncbi:MAG: 2-keto-4-pentenoate hydratase [Pontixanthobacter sp.]
MTSTSNFAVIAQAFVDARRSGGSIHEFPGTRPTKLVDAYKIQDHSLSIWDRSVGGWKVGKISPSGEAQLGANRLIGPVFEDMIFHQEGEAIAMPVFAKGFAAAEAEFMLRISPTEGRALPRTNEEALSWVDQIRIGIEIASSPYSNINLDGPCVTIADHGNNAGLVLGPKVDRSVWPKLDDIQVKTIIDGTQVGQATTASMLDGPFGAVRFLLTNLNERGIAPQSDWWISTGAITGVHEAKVGAKIECQFEGLGSVLAAFS